MINIILLLAGMLLDAISIYYVFLPFMLPIMAHFNWDPVWFGIMMTVNLARAGDAARGREPVCRRQYQRHQHGTHPARRPCR